MDNQFYPSPKILANLMVSKFVSNINSDSVVLEPSAGRGALIDAIRERKVTIRGQEFTRSAPKTIDVIELDSVNVTILQSMKGVSVVGYDFLEFSTHKMYTHCILNPPFNTGALHVLKAWDTLYNGEIVAIVNAETIRNPNDKHKALLCRIIEDNNGTIEYLSEQFTTADTMRKTSVEIALIHLTKRTEMIDTYVDGLKPEIYDTPDFNDVNTTADQLAIPESNIEQAVKIFTAAAQCLKDECAITAQLHNNTAYYFGLLADSIIRSDEEVRRSNREFTNSISITADFNERYELLKEKAWSHVLAASDIKSGLSSGVVNSIQNGFKEIAQLEFTKSNIHGFLANLGHAKMSGSIDMFCNAFDEFTKYSIGNRAYYKGWKSNDKHKTQAFKLKTTRFITKLRDSTYSVDFRDIRAINDVDLAFAALDGKKRDDTVGISDLLDNKESLLQLKNGERLSASYFDIRFYSGVGSVHVFPRSKSLIDRLNRVVGQHRQWLPPADTRISKCFWLQYDKAEMLQTELDKCAQFKKLSNYDLIHDESKVDLVDELITNAGKNVGLDMDFELIETSQPAQLTANS